MPQLPWVVMVTAEAVGVDAAGPVAVDGEG
jgi:hypothetical protein